MKYMKIGLVMAYKGVNYGMLLQAFATQKVIESLGYETEILDYTRTDLRHVRFTPYMAFYALYEHQRKKKLKVRNLQQEHAEYIYKTNYIERKAVSNSFIDRRLANKYKCVGILELENHSKQLNGVLVGSDQLWSPDAVFGNFTTLRFAPDEMNKVSYATSLGVSSYPFWCKESAAQFWKRMNHISVREERGKQIIQSICNVPVQVVVDPTYLLTKEEWEKLIPQKQIIKEEYILCYFLGNAEEHKKLSRAFADRHKIKLISILSTESISSIDISYADEVITGKGPEDFINLIRGAKYVLTDSFHGVAFSVINNKQFYVFYRTKVGSKNSRNSRIDNILKMWNLEDRLVLNDAAIDDFAKKEIDYRRVNALVEMKREHSINYLTEALGDCK